MGRREGDLALRLLRFLVFVLVILGTEGYFPHPSGISPTSFKAFASIIHAVVPFISTSQQAPIQHKSPESISPRSKRLSPSSSNPTSTQIRNGAPAAPAPRAYLLSTPAVHPNVPKIVPLVVPSPAAKRFKGSSPLISPKLHQSNNAHSPSTSHQPAPANSVPQHKKEKRGNTVPAPLSSPPSAATSDVSPVASPSHPPIKIPKRNKRHFAPPDVEGPEVNPSTSHPPFPTMRSYAPSPHVEGPVVKRAHSRPPLETPKKPYLSPATSPTTRQKNNRWSKNHLAPSPSYFTRKPPSPSAQPILSLPPPPPNFNCGPMTCQEPLVNPSPGSPCACALPIKVGLTIGVALYTFFPLVSEFAQEIASGIFVKQSQVRIMGANTAFEDPEKSVVLVDLVPLGQYFDNTTVFLIYEKLWQKQVAIQASYFGNYDVSYVLYPGLPLARPTAPAYVSAEGGAHRNDNNGRAIRPLGVDVMKREKMKLSGSMIAIIVLSSLISMILIVGVAYFLLRRHWKHSDLPSASCQSLQAPFAKLSVARALPMIAGSRRSSTSASFSSSIATYTGSAKKFSLYEIEKITNKFDESRIIGEGGFGRVFLGTIEDGTRVAVKLLMRDDQQGGREFMAEVEMLGRLHHRNLVKLIGICSEENTRCLIYELVPNGSVESHLHGVDKEIAPLDWPARMKIALGAARGLAYLHEDSSPRVIHRDFKSSNILLEYDFTPKVSDFGLARTALDEGEQHISTRVMGTFGYVAPEYAMTGHLLVKSDVYSYGVVLLELLTGRKPVDLSQPPGQENLVSWARPLLTQAERIVDPTLGSSCSNDSILKVMAIASLCVEPEVAHRPFMGEVVQALRVVCSESEECSNGGSSSVKEMEVAGGGMLRGTEREISRTSVMYVSEGFVGNYDASGMLQMHSSSGPIRTERSRNFWQSVRGLASRSVSEHRISNRWWSRSEHGERWPT